MQSPGSLARPHRQEGGEARKVTGRADDHEEFLGATLRHADLLHALALRLAPHPADAADIVQETYLRAYAAWRRRRPADMGAWLATICLNVGRDEQRRHARRSAAVSEGPVPDLPDRADTAEAALERLGTSRINAALRVLPDGQRIAITLMDLCGFTAAQAAAITGAPRGTILARVHRGRKALAITLGDDHQPANLGYRHEPRP
jgi:RNA polymerase sigma-70 factor, ECF subfamily